MPMHTADVVELQWEVQGPFEVADDGRRLYVRDTIGSEVLGTIVGVVVMVGAGIGGWRLVQQDGLGARAVGGVFLLVAAFLAAVALRQLLGAVGLSKARTRVPLVTFDRGDAGGSPAEIHCSGRRLAVHDIRCLSTRRATVGSRHDAVRHIVVAEMNDGTEMIVGLDGPPSWTAHYAVLGARWLGLPYRPHAG